MDQLAMDVALLDATAALAPNMRLRHAAPDRYLSGGFDPTMWDGAMLFGCW